MLSFCFLPEQLLVQSEGEGEVDDGEVVDRQPADDPYSGEVLGRLKGGRVEPHAVSLFKLSEQLRRQWVDPLS